jgi:hypothetical protein
MPGAHPNDMSRASVRGMLVAACTAVLVPAMVVTSAGAAPQAAPQGARLAAAPTSGATAPPTASSAAVRQPTVRAVPLAGVDRSVLALTPKVHADEPAAGQLGQMAAHVRTKPAVAATLVIRRPAELVAVSADEPFPAGTTIQMRVKDAAGWSEWSDLHVDPEHGPDPASAEARRARVGSDPLMAQDARRVQVRIDTPDGRVPKGTELTLVDAPAAPSDAAARGMAQMATVGLPPIVTRAQWGANESWRSRQPIYTSDLRAGFVHHTASTSNYSPEQAAAQVRAIYAYHTKSLKHSDIDYNFVVDRFGRLYEGRAGGIDQPVLGGHTAGFNEHTFAVVALGNFSTFNPSATDMAAIKDSIARLFAWKLGLHGVNPGSTASLVSAGFWKRTRYPRGTVASIPAVSSHQTVNFTACPGSNLQAQMPSIRELAAQYSDVVISAPSPTGTSVVAGQAGPITFTSSANRAVSWTADVLSPCSDTPVRTFTGSTPGAGPISVSWDFTDAAGAPVLPARYTIRMSGTAADGTPVATVTSDVTVAPAPGGGWGPCANASRVAGASVAETSVLWGRITAPGARTVVVSGAGSGTASLAAGLAAAPLARSLGAALLLTSRDVLDGPVAADLTARGATEVLVVGGADVVSDAVLASIGGLGATVTRVAGGTAAETAAAVAGRMPPATPVVLVSPDGSPAHAVAGAALAAQLGGPVLMAAGGSIPPATQAALAGRPSVTVAASVALADATIAAALPSTPWTRLAGADAASASAAVASAFPATVESASVLPDNPVAWVTAPVAAATGAPLLITPSPSLSVAVADAIRARPALRATTTTVSAAWLDDQVLGATSRILLGLPWAPPGVALGPAQPTAPQPATYRVGAANASPEPVKRGRSLKVTAKVTVKSGKKYVSAPAGVPFVVQFKATGKKKYRQVASGTTTRGRATATVTATSSGRWRIVVGTKASSSDQVRVRK